VTHNDYAKLIRESEVELSDDQIYALAKHLARRANHIPKPDPFAVRRSESAGDCRLWAPRDALLSAVHDIDEGKIHPDKLVVHYREPSPEDSNEILYRYYAAGVTNMEHAGLLAMHLARVSAQ